MRNAAAGLAAVDQRTVLGAPVWIKPLKFAVSFLAYSGALAWMLGQLPPVSRAEPVLAQRAGFRGPPTARGGRFNAREPRPDADRAPLPPTPVLGRTGWVIVAASAIEMAVIAGQAARGVRSHFNDDTIADGVPFTIMGLTIAALYVATFAIALRFLDPACANPATTGPRPSRSGTASCSRWSAWASA